MCGPAMPSSTPDAEALAERIVFRGEHNAED
jgi:hypothetical protein